jgi:hypothetical protein
LSNKISRHTATVAAISAPTPPVIGASWLINNRPVLLTDWQIVSASHGTIVRRSITSQDIFSFAAICATSRGTWTCVPHETRVISEPSLIIWAFDNGIVYSFIGTSSLADR